MNTTNRQSKKDIMYAKILQHGENLNTIFNTGIEPIALCKKLRRFELAIHALCVIECNTGDDKDGEIEVIKAKVINLLFPDKKNVNKDLLKALFVNGDPRGYALKIKTEYVKDHDLKIEQDWGGYGLICPDFS